MITLEQIWTEPKKFWGYPQIAEPILVHNTKDFKETDVYSAIKSELEFLCLEDKQVYVSLPTVDKLLRPKDEKERSRFAELLLYHGTGHYGLIPFDLKNQIVLTYMAKGGIESIKGIEKHNMANASIIVNMFSDTVLNTYLFEKGIEDIAEIYVRLTDKKEQSLLQRIFMPENKDAWNLYMRSYEMLWNTPGKIVGKQKGIIESTAGKIYDLFQTSIYSSTSWPEQVTEYAKLISPFMKKNPRRNKNLKHMEDGESGELNKVKKEMKKRSKGAQEEYKKKIEKGLRAVSQKNKNKESTRRQYKDIVTEMGLGDENLADVWFYRNIASPYAVKFLDVETFSQDSHPSSPSKWNPEDPISDLDFVYSTLSHGKVIPSLSTYSWQQEKSQGEKRGSFIPDIYIIIDSSGSMINPQGNVSPAVVGGFVASECAFNKGAAVGALNFSGSGQEIIVPETKDKDLVGKALVSYFGGWTDMPTTAFSKLQKRKHNPKHIMLISDSGIWNFERSFPYLKNLMKSNPQNTGSFFWTINGYESTSNDVVTKLEDIGFQIYVIKEKYDLLNPILGKAKELYGGKL